VRRIVLTEEQFEPWLSGEAGRILNPAATDYLQTWPVSKRVDSSKADADDPTLDRASGIGERMDRFYRPRILASIRPKKPRTTVCFSFVAEGAIGGGVRTATI
jgi:hypothetical protein